MSSLVAVLRAPPPCPCACHETLTLAQRTADVAALFRFDDAMRGWGYVPDYTTGAHRLWRAAQLRGDPGYRGVAVRDDACVHRRLVGFAVHEILHALCGDTSKANYGILFGLPYGVPVDVPPAEEKAYLARFNEQEARAFVGVAPLARALFGIDWAVYTARDVGTYGFAGGFSLVDVPPGYRPVPHVDRINQPERYYALARRLEREAASWIEANLAALVAGFEAAETRGRASRREAFPDPAELAARQPREPAPNEPCSCGSGKKFKRCCGVAL